MNILIIINSLQFGGAEKQVITDANMLSIDNNVFIYVNNRGGLFEKLNKKINVINSSKKKLISINIEILKLTRRFNIDVVFAHMYWAQKASFVSNMLNKKLKTYFFDHGFNLWKHGAHIFLTHLLAWRIQKIIVVSNAKMKVKNNKERFSLSKLIVIPNSYDEVKNHIRNQHKIPFTNNKFTIGFVGRFNKVKQLELLIEIANRLKHRTKNFSFVLIGDGDEMTNIKKLIEVKNLDKYFQITGYISDPILYMKYFDIFVLPSEIEDLSVALLDAGSAGLPSIVFDVGGNRDIVVDGKNGFIIPPFHIDLFIDKILVFIRDKELVFKFGEDARKMVKMKFSREERLIKLNELIRN